MISKFSKRNIVPTKTKTSPQNILSAFIFYKLTLSDGCCSPVSGDESGALVFT